MNKNEINKRKDKSTRIQNFEEILFLAIALPWLLV